MLLRSLARAHPRSSTQRLYSSSSSSSAVHESNARIADYLARNLKAEEESPDRNAYKVRSYLAAIAAIRAAPEPITSGKDAAALRGVGTRIADRVHMFLQGQDYGPDHESAARLKFALNRALCTIPGVGARTADKLIAAGVTSLHDLRHPEHFRRLTPAQRIGLVYAKPLAEPISRSDAELVLDFIRDHVSSNFELDLVGEYRRGLDPLPSISILLTHPHHVHVPLPLRPSAPPRGSGAAPLPFFDRAAPPADALLLFDAIRPLEDAGLLAATISSSARRWVGVATLPKRADGGRDGWGNIGQRLRDIRHRRGSFVRLEICLAPVKSRAPATLALTGDADFCHAVRLAAHKQGLYLNEYGLWRWTPSSSSSSPDTDPDPELYAHLPSTPTSPGTWTLIPTPTEHDLLTTLSLPPTDPTKRNFIFLRSKPSARASASASTSSSKQQEVVTLPDDAIESMHRDLMEMEGEGRRGRGRPKGVRHPAGAKVGRPKKAKASVDESFPPDEGKGKGESEAEAEASRPRRTLTPDEAARAVEPKKRGRPAKTAPLGVPDAPPDVDIFMPSTTRATPAAAAGSR